MDDAAPTPDDDLEVRVPSEPEKPVSILAILALILAFVSGFVSLVGIWQAALVPVAVAAIALLIIKKTGKRGRLPAIFAIIVSSIFGSCAWLGHSKGISMFSEPPRAVLEILADGQASESERDARLAAWAAPDAVAAQPDLVERWRDAYAAVAQEFGAWQGDVEAGDHQIGFLALWTAPEVGAPIPAERATEPAASGGSVWVQAAFAKGAVWVELVFLGGAEDLREAVTKELALGSPRPIVSDLRFFRVK